MGGIYVVSNSLHITILPDNTRSCSASRVSIVENMASYSGAILLSTGAKVYTSVCVYTYGGKMLGPCMDNKQLELRNNHAC